MTTGRRKLVLVRHGETVGESSIRYFGVTDVPLSDAGCRQMERVRASLLDERFDAVYTSCLQRTIAAARIIAPRLHPQPLAGFNEVNFGDWEGLTREEIAQRDPARYEQWCMAPHDFTYPGGDAVLAFRARVVETLRRLLPDLPACALVVAHKGVIASVLAELLRLSPTARAARPIDLASVHTLEATDGTWRAVDDERRALTAVE